MKTINKHILVQADAVRIPLPDGCVQVVVTSPPYFGLRDYGVPGQIGLEKTPESYVAAMVRVFREVRRVLRDDGTCWLNLGDSYTSIGRSPRDESPGVRAKQALGRVEREVCWTPRHGGDGGFKWTMPGGQKPKDLVGIPWAVAFALRADGWHLRSAPPWVKVNSMPESVEDRPTTAHENLFLLTKRDIYYYDADAVRAPSASSTLERDKYSRIVQSGNKSHVPGSPDHSGLHAPYAVVHDHETPSNPAGRNRRTSDWFLESLDECIAEQRAYLAHLESVRRKGGMLLDEGGDPLAMVVSTESFRGGHFAVMPRRLVEPCLKASTSQAGACGKCGAPLARVTETGQSTREGPVASGWREASQRGYPDRVMRIGERPSVTIGWTPTCSCLEAANSRPCLVLDPFCGAATTIVVAETLGLRAIGLDLSRDYLNLSKRRLERPHARIAAPAARDKPMPLFDLLGGQDDA